MSLHPLHDPHHPKLVVSKVILTECGFFHQPLTQSVGVTGPFPLDFRHPPIWGRGGGIQHFY